MPAVMFANSRQVPLRRGEQSESDEAKAKDCQKYLAVLAQQRLQWEPMIDNIIQYVNHSRRFVQDTNLYDGQQTGQYVYDDSAMLARNTLVDGMVGNLCSRNQPWFGLQIPGKFNFPRSSGMRSWTGQRIDSYPIVQKWLQDSETVMYSAFNRSNFYDSVTEFISDGSTCGTGYTLAEEDIQTSTIVFTVPHFRECYIANDQFGQVDTVYRVYKMTLRQLAQKFGMKAMEAADRNFKRDYDSNFYEEREILHAIYPRTDRDPWRADARNKPWASVWVYRKGGCIQRSGGAIGDATGGAFLLSEGGYDSMPAIAWRWRRNSDEVYGRGPAHDAFVSIATANQIARTNMKTAQRAAEPPLAAYSDMRGAIQKGANGITYMENNRGDIRARMPQPLYTGVQNLPFTIEFQQSVDRTIKEFFFNDIFNMMSQLSQDGNQSRMVIEHVMALQGEKAATLGTRVGNLQSEAFDPIIDRVYSIEAEAGRIPAPPDILLESSHGPVEVQYLGPLAQAQTRLTTLRSIDGFLGEVVKIAQVDPTIIHAVNAPYILRVVRDNLNVPVDAVYDEKTYATIMQGLQHQQQVREEAETIPKFAKAAASLSKSPESGSILKELMGGDNAQ